MRLWSTVVTHDATRPRRQSARYVSVLTATRRPLVDVPPEVHVERRELLARPAAADGRHVAVGRRDPVLAVLQQPPQPLRLGQDRARRDVRPVVALALRPVALGADARPFVASEVPRGLGRDPRLVVRERLGQYLRLHLRMEDAAKLAAAAAVRPRGVRLEPRLGVAAGYRVELAPELRDPPAVVDVVRVDLHLHHAVDRHVHLVDRDRTRGISELPVELVRVDPYLERPTLCLGGRDVLDARQLVEDEAEER